MTDTISRRGAFSILGLATLGLVVTPTLLVVSDAEAQNSTQAPQTTTTTTQAPKSSTKTTEAPQTGTERRKERRTARTKPHEEHNVGSGGGTTNKPQ
jgi:hypothetical protein